MATQWYLKIGGKRAGPLSARQLKSLAESGQVSPDDLVRQASGGSWVPAGSVKGLFTATDSADKESSASEMPVAKRLEEPIEESKSAPSPPKLPDSAPSEPGPSLDGFSVVGDSPTDRVLGRSRARGSGPRRARRLEPVITAGAAVLLIGVVVLGAGLMMSRNGKAKAPPANPNATEEPTVNGPGPEERVAEAPPVEEPKDLDVDIEDLGIEGLESLEELGILGPGSAKTESTEQSATKSGQGSGRKKPSGKGGSSQQSGKRNSANKSEQTNGKK